MFKQDELLFHDTYGKIGRSDMVSVLGITPSPASALIKKLLEAGKIKAVTGHGKGKYVIKCIF